MQHNNSKDTIRQSTQEYMLGLSAPTPGKYLSKPLLVCRNQSEKLLDGKSVAVVGNSGKLLYHNYGEAIDAHDAVIRFNWAPTEGYEAQVGSKTTIRLSNTHYLKAVTDDKFDEKMGKNYTGWDKDFYFTKIKNQTIVLKKMSSWVNDPETDWRINKRIEEVGNNTIDCLEERFMTYCDAILHPKLSSMGLLGVAMGIANRDEGHGAKSIDCYGFNFYEEEEEDRHYYDVMTQSKEQQAEHHNFDQEKGVFLTLVNEGVIKIHD